MSWLSPVQWAKWTWSAVSGAPGDAGMKDGEDNSDTEGNFETPEAESPCVVNLLSQLDNSKHTGLPDVSNHSPVKNSKKDIDSVDSLNNLSSNSPNNSFSLDQNLNMTRSSKSSPVEDSSPSTRVSQPQVVRPPSLSVLSSLNKPDPAEVDDEAPVSSDSSPDTNSILSRDICVDSDLLNGNTRLMLSNEKLTCEANKSIITNSCKVKQKQPMQTELNGQDDHHGGHATDEEKLAVSVSDCHVTSKPEDSDCCSVKYEDTCKLKNTARGSEMQKTGSQVLDSICISEAEKQAVLALIREEIITKEVEVNDWKTKYEECRQQLTEMSQVVAEYEKTVAQMIEDEQRSSANAQKALHEVVMEKEAALADLNSVERSLSDMFRRYENMKSTLEGFKRNEELLKKSAQEYLARVKQEEHRYHTLKIHAEEKLDKAIEELAQVRAKASSENMALTASLRKEQIKNESLDQALQQKNQEMEELTKICNELIARMGKVD